MNLVVVVEFYDRTIEDITSLSSPSNAFARFSNQCFTWVNSTGSYDYLAKIVEFPSVSKTATDKQNEAEIVISNTERGTNSGARFILNNKIKGSWMVIRLIDPDREDYYEIKWWGKCLRPGAVNNTQVSIVATQEIGNYKIKIPFRTYGARCPLVPGRGGCLGTETLEEKSETYQQAFSEYGTMLCPDRTYETCNRLSNTDFFQGQRLVAVSGTFSYISKDDIANTTQKKNKKSKLPPLKTESWSSINQSDSEDVVPLCFGRSQLAGHPFSWADKGTSLYSLQGFCEGEISDFDFIRSRNEEWSISTIIEHYGDYGGQGSQTPDSLFGGLSGTNSRLAYIEVVTNGSEPDEVDGAPLITAVIRGLKIPTRGVDGEFNTLSSSSNPVDVVRYLLTDPNLGRVPPYRIEDNGETLITSNICDSLVEDRTNSENIVLPVNEYQQYGVGFRRYRSVGVYTAYSDLYEHGGGEVLESHPDFEDPYVRWYSPDFQPPLLPRNNVLRKRYTVNGALQEKTSLLDFIQRRLFPCFRGWLNYNDKGKIEVRTRKPADTAYLRADFPEGQTLVPINNVSKWVNDKSQYIVVGVGNTNSEVRKVKDIKYSAGCNNIPIDVESSTAIETEIYNISGGSLFSPGEGFIQLTGSPQTGDYLKVTFNRSPDDFFIKYTCDGVETSESLARLFTAYLNANPNFSNYLTAYISPSIPNRINIRCQAGFLEVDPLEYAHSIGEEVIRVKTVFENKYDLEADSSANFDNIIADSFSWNTQENNDDTNAYTAKYTSAVDDFSIAKLIPRTSWDTIDYEGELNEEELDLTFVDNYWQAAYLTKAFAIENIDGNISFSWGSGYEGFQVEPGDVVAIRHDSGDGVLRYTPVWLEEISYNLSNFTTQFKARLYLSVAWDDRVQPIDPLLTTTLNPNFPGIIPDPIGSTGGVGDSDEWTGRQYPTYSYFRDSRYSNDGRDIL